MASPVPVESPRTRSHTATLDLLRKLLQREGLGHWFYPFSLVLQGSFASFVDSYDLRAHPYPSEASSAACSVLVQCDDDVGNMPGNICQLPEATDVLWREWRAVEGILRSNYARERARLDKDTLGDPASGGHKKKKKKRSRDERSSSDSGARDASDNTSSSDGGHADRRDKAQRQQQRDTKAAAGLVEVYEMLNGGFKVDARSVPSFSQVLKVHDSRREATINFPKEGYLFKEEGKWTKENDGGFSANHSKLYILVRFKLVLTTWALSFSVDLSSRKSSLGCLEHCESDETMLLSEAGGAPRRVGVIPQLVTRFAQRVENLLAPEDVNSFQAYTMCANLLASVAGIVQDTLCTLTAAVLTAQGLVGNLTVPSKARGGSASSAPAGKRPEPCSHWARHGSCNMGENCRFGHSDKPGGGRSNSQASNASKKGGRSKSRSPGNANAGQTPGAARGGKKRVGFDP